VLVSECSRDIQRVVAFNTLFTLGLDPTLVEAPVRTVRGSSPPTPRPEGGLWSARESAGYLGVSLSHFKDVVRPEVPTVPIGRRRLYDRKDLDRWAIMQKVGSSGSTPTPGGAIRFASGTMDAATNDPRAQAILKRLRSKPRGSIQT
jgi:hypothetical protein